MGRNTGARHHTHKYFRSSIDGLWHCGLPRCTHYMPGNMPVPAWKMSICWTCGAEVELNPDNMRADNPVHDDCRPYAASPVRTSEHDEEIDDYIEQRLHEARMKKLATPPAIEEPESENSIEVIADHAPDCESWLGKDCTCGLS